LILVTFNGHSSQTGSKEGIKERKLSFVIHIQELRGGTTKDHGRNNRTDNSAKGINKLVHSLTD